VTFTSTSLNAKDYSWNFGDGKTSQAQNPSNSYASSGNYTVRLTVSNTLGSDDTTMVVTVNSDIPTFFKRFGGSANDVGNSVIETQDQFYIITGTSNSPDILNGQTTDHLILWKFDVLGGKVWTLPKIVKPNSYGHALIEDEAGRYVVVGYERNTPGASEIETPLFLKFDQAGTVVKIRDLDSPIRSFTRYTVLNDILNVGTQYAITGYSGLCAPGCPHITLSYLDAEGTVIDATWSTDSFTGDDARGRAISKSPLRVVSMGDQDGNIIVRENPGINSMEFIDNIFTAQGAQRGNDIVGTNDGNFTIVGTTDMGSNGGVDILFMVINNNLNQVGSTVNIGGSVSDFAESIIAHEGDYIIAGASNSFSNDGNFDVYLLRVTKTGQVVWQETLNRADGDDFATEIVATSDGGFIITGYTEYPNNTRDLFLLKTDDMGKVVQ
jgi:PKD repeat protein